MKIRTGFVSNSSSSSFCLVGYAIDMDYDNDDELEEKFKDSNLIIRCGISDLEDCYIVGKDIYSMKDEETLLEFKKHILEELQKYYDKDISISDINIFVDGGTSY